MNEETLYNLAFERSILSSIVFDPASFKEISLDVADFYLAAHQKIYEAMVWLDKEDKPIDEEFIKVYLTNQKCFDERTMVEVLTANPISNVREYVARVRELAQMRALIMLGVNLRKHEFHEVSEAINYAESSLKSIIDMHIGGGIGCMSITDIPDGKTEFILENWLPFPRGTVSMIAAPGGTGKSWAASQIAFRYCDESPYSKVALWLSEDPAHETKNRAKAVALDILHTPFSQYKNVHLITERPKPVIYNGKYDAQRFYRMKKSLKGYDLVILDPMRSFFGGDENSNTDANIFMGPFQDWAAEENITIIFLHHSKKDKDDGIDSKARGASAFIDACRTVYEFRKVYKNARIGELDIDNQHMREVILSKDNFGVVRMFGGYKVQKHITPKSSARATALQVDYQIKDDDMKFEMPEIRE